MSLRDRWRYSATNTRLWNWRNRRAILRGRRDAAARAGDAIRSRTPVLRSRVNPATGRQHREDARLGRMSDRSLARAAISRQVRPVWYPGEPAAPRVSDRQMRRLRAADPVPGSRTARTGRSR